MAPLRLSILSLLLLLLLCPASLPAAETGQPLIPFKGNDLNGQPIDLHQSIGKKPILLVFWASWCPSCRQEVPKINQLAEKYRDRGMLFVGVDIGYNDTVERAQAFARKTGMTYPTFFDGTGAVTAKYKLVGVPTIIVADKKGIIRFRNYATPAINDSTFAQLMAD